jgi:choline dehydrogenase-like flavoprotein
MPRRRILTDEQLAELLALPVTESLLIRHCCSEIGRPARGAGDQSALSLARDRPARRDRRAACGAPAVRRAGAQTLCRRRDLPGKDVESDEALLDYLRHTGSTVFHATCTCKMGRDAMAVVDDQLRVHGIDGLRVIDASVMPSMTSTNTNAPTIMIAEKGAAMIQSAARQLLAA